jgi:Opioid growth factor receptor (OGFr) conserved region
MSQPDSRDPIVAFFSGGRDSEGRTLDAILSWNDDQLEAVHDYIQWVFPTRQPSGVNPLAPTVTKETVRAFERDPTLRSTLQHALDRMLAFYGLTRAPKGSIQIDRERFAARASVWLHPGNHNHLRLTRIMDSLTTLGLHADALALQQCLLGQICAGPGRGRVSARTTEFWRRAVDSA